MLNRQFGSGDHKVFLSMRSYAPGYNFEITLSGQPIAPFRWPGKATVTFGSAKPEIMQPIPSSTETYGPAILFVSDIHATAAVGQKADSSTHYLYPDLNLEAHFDGITLATASQTLVLETGPMATAMQVLRQCTDDLLKHWGLDPQVQSHLKRGVTSPNSSSWTKKMSDKYPWDLSRKGLNAVVNIIVIVDQEGRPTKCMIHKSFTNTQFTDNRCNIIMKYAQFTPALDEQGNPVPSYIIQKLVYHIGAW